MVIAALLVYYKTQKLTKISGEVKTKFKKKTTTNEIKFPALCQTICNT